MDLMVSLYFQQMTYLELNLHNCAVSSTTARHKSLRYTDLTFVLKGWNLNLDDRGGATFIYAAINGIGRKICKGSCEDCPLNSDLYMRFPLPIRGFSGRYMRAAAKSKLRLYWDFGIKGC